jgi:hypothetical protein
MKDLREAIEHQGLQILCLCWHGSPAGRSKEEAMKYRRKGFPADYLRGGLMSGVLPQLIDKDADRNDVAGEYIKQLLALKCIIILPDPSELREKHITNFLKRLQEAALGHNVKIIRQEYGESTPAVVQSAQYLNELLSSPLG